MGPQWIALSVLVSLWNFGLTHPLECREALIVSFVERVKTNAWEDATSDACSQFWVPVPLMNLETGNLEVVSTWYLEQGVSGQRCNLAAWSRPPQAVQPPLASPGHVSSLAHLQTSPHTLSTIQYDTHSR